MKAGFRSGITGRNFCLCKTVILPTRIVSPYCDLKAVLQKRIVK